jgi:putative transcriptional regulator
MSEIGQSLIRGAEEALGYIIKKTDEVKTHKVQVPLKIDVSAIRKNLHMSRQRFSEEFGFSIRTLEKWERGERSPEGPTRAYLTVIAKNPRAVIDVLHQDSNRT